jgi:hypothetical protein
LQLVWVKLQHPGPMLELVLVVQHWVIRFSIHPHAVDDFEPAVGQPAQGIGVTAPFVPVVAVVNVRPGTLAEGLLGKQVHGVAQVFVAGPPLVAGPARRVAPSFAGPAGHRGGAGQTLQRLGIVSEGNVVGFESRPPFAA